MSGLNPDCAAGKCGGCSGDAWDNDADEPVACAHECHGPQTPAAAVAQGEGNTAAAGPTPSEAAPPVAASEGQTLPLGGANPPDAAQRGPRVIGLDLSLTSTGVASNYGWTERIRTKLTGHERLQRILDEIGAFTASADLVVIESLAFHGHDTGGASAGLAWLVRHRLWWKGKPYALVTPGQRMIYATGSGRADKDQVLAAVIRRYPTFEVASNDEADALVLAAMGARHLGHPIDDLPKTHTRALDKVEWPEQVTAP